jgi:hypothetical protein
MRNTHTQRQRQTRIDGIEPLLPVATDDVLP